MDETIGPIIDTAQEKKLDEVKSITNSMITATKKGDKVKIRVLREAVKPEDVQLCLDVFHDFMHKYLQPEEKVRVLVEAQLKVNVLQVKKKIVEAFIDHFKANLKLYDSHLKKCALIVSDAALAKMFTGVVFLIIHDSKRILVTHRIERAEMFLKE